MFESDSLWLRRNLQRCIANILQQALQFFLCQVFSLGGALDSQFFPSLVEFEVDRVLEEISDDSIRQDLTYLHGYLVVRWHKIVVERPDGRLFACFVLWLEEE